MQTNHFHMPMTEQNTLHFTPKRKPTRPRKWREIEEIKDRQNLIRELREIDQSFELSLSELV